MTFPDTAVATLQLRPIVFEPDFRAVPPRLLDVQTGWRPFETMLGAIVERFCRNRDIALEFGVERGFSISALSNYFTYVVGVDHFRGDSHAGLTPPGVDRFAETAAALTPFTNVHLVNREWRTYAGGIDARNSLYNLIHVDIFHDYDTTYACGEWAVWHSSCVLFHDTHHPAFDGVMPAVRDLAVKYRGLTWYDNAEGSGLSLLVRP